MTSPMPMWQAGGEKIVPNMDQKQPITTDTIRNWVMDDGGIAEYHDPINGHLAAKHAGKMFDAWLAEHDAEVRQVALEDAAATVDLSATYSYGMYADVRRDCAKRVRDLCGKQRENKRPGEDA